MIYLIPIGVYFIGVIFFLGIMVADEMRFKNPDYTRNLKYIVLWPYYLSKKYIKEVFE